VSGPASEWHSDLRDGYGVKRRIDQGCRVVPLACRSRPKVEWLSRLTLESRLQQLGWGQQEQDEVRAHSHSYA
jgi:hypothetical protein